MQTTTSKVAADDWGGDTADTPLGKTPGKDFPRMNGPRVLLRPRKAKEKIGSIIMPDSSKEAEEIATCVGEVIHVGPGAYTDDKTPFPNEEKDGSRPTWTGWNVPKPGDFVIFGKYAGTRIKFNGVKLVIVNDEEIMAFVDSQEGVHAFF